MTTHTMASAFPVDDWQFWVVTGVFVLVSVVMGAGVVRSIRGKKKARATRVSLTVGGKSVDKADARGTRGG